MKRNIQTFIVMTNEFCEIEPIRLERHCGLVNLGMLQQYSPGKFQIRRKFRRLLVGIKIRKIQHVEGVMNRITNVEDVFDKRIKKVVQQIARYPICFYSMKMIC